MNDKALEVYFRLFNEIAIIQQLSSTLLQSRLPKGMLVSHFSVLNHFMRVQNGQTPLALAKAFQVPKTTMTHTLAGLEKQALVELRPNPKDGRSKCVWITDAGRDFRNTAIASMTTDLLQLSATIPVDKVQQLLPALTEIRIYLDTARNEVEDNS